MTRKSTTVQATGKKYKAAMVLGGLLAITGAAIYMQNPPLGVRLGGAGFAIFISAKALAWWQHG
jgi:hypothetical protein